MTTEKNDVTMRTCILQLCQAFPDIVTYREVVNFFTLQWAPVVEKFHSGHGNVIEDFLTHVADVIKDLSTYEVSSCYRSRSLSDSGYVYLKVMGI